MAPLKNGARRRDAVSATELAEMAVCERRVQLTHLHGPRYTRPQRLSMRRGVLAHAQFHREGLAAGRIAEGRRGMATR